jgi:regulator of sigma E protease
MVVLIKIVQLFFALSILVIIHECGHFLFARLFKVRVEKFFLFFDWGFSLFKRKIGDTEYGIGWLPLGGYVKISGMIDESMDLEQMKQPPQPWEFRSKPAYQRLIIMLAGVVFNVILAIFLYVMILNVWGYTYLAAKDVKYGIVTDSTGYEMGLRNGDKIISLDGVKVEDFYKIIPDILLNERKTITVDRDGQMTDIPIERRYIGLMMKGKGEIDARIPFGPFVVSDLPKKNSPARDAGVIIGDEIVKLDNIEFKWYDEFQTYLRSHIGIPVTVSLIRGGKSMDISVKPNTDGMLGVARTAKHTLQLTTIHYKFFESIPAGINKGITAIGDYVKQFKLIFNRETKGYESLGGFITIGKIFPGTWDWQSFWTLTAFISIILAVMNILPIPALDGGFVMFLIYEVVTGRKPSDKFLEYAQITGMIILFALLIFANGNDILRLFRK